MSEQRIERWYVRCAGVEVGPWVVRDDAVRYQNKCNGELIRLVEIRDGESVRDDFAHQANLEAHANQLREFTERAEKAEAEAKIAAAVVHARNAEIDTLRAFLKQFEDGGMSGREVRAAKADERARFERETAAKMLAGLWASEWNGDIAAALKVIVDTSKNLADHYFGAKESANG